MGKKIAALLCVFLLAALLIGGMQLTKKQNEVQIEGAGDAANAELKPRSLTYQGEEYPLKKHIQTLLLIGTDSTEAYEEQEGGLKKFYNFNQADFLMLLVLDRDAQSTEIIQLNRDTMMDVPWLDVLGEYGGTEYKQLCLAFNSGSGGADSCKNTVDAVSKLLFDAPIDGYVQVPMTAIGVLNDLVGGVPVTITEDLTRVDPAFIQGATVKLSGAQAEKFVRARKVLEDDTNLARMRRQRDYMNSFQERARAALNSDSEFAMKLLEKLDEYLQTSLTGQQLSDLVERLDEARISPIRYGEGELIKGEEYYEFYADTDSLWEIVRHAYCE